VTYHTRLPASNCCKVANSQNQSGTFGPTLYKETDSERRIPPPHSHKMLAHLADDCRLLSDVGRRPLRSNSNDMRKLLVPRTHNKLGDRSFSAAGPRLWNDLPPGLRRPGLTFDSFRQSLKKLIHLATEALSDSFECIGAIEISLSIYTLTYSDTDLWKGVLFAVVIVVERRDYTPLY